MVEDNDDYMDWTDKEDDLYCSDDDDDHLEVDELDHALDSDVADCSFSFPHVITRNSLLTAQREDLRKVMDLLGVQEHHARTLLIYFRWDVLRIFELLERKGVERLFSEAGVALHKQNCSFTSSIITCNVCFDDFSADGITLMDCGHYYCNDCWTEHFMVKINDGQSRQIRCMAHKCNAICDEAIVRTLVSKRDPDVANRFERFLLESYIEDNNKVKWCPSIPHCGNAIRVDGDPWCEVECSCGQQLCFNCLSEAHSPCSCMMWELWSKKCQDESENNTWLTAYTKPCPKCCKNVEKNGGCNLVACVCGQHFCWLCGEATGSAHTWTSIQGHSCGRYAASEEDKNKKRAKHGVDRYLHYYRRYKAHIDSLKQEKKLKEAIKVKVDISEAKKDSEIKDYDWVFSGLRRLSNARRVLSYTYPFAFYMFGKELFKNQMSKEERLTKQNLFEDQQQQLESDLEKLSKFLEMDFQWFSDKEVFNMRTNVINLSNIVNTFCKEMYNCIDNDLFGQLPNSGHNIAPYNPQGLQRAPEVSVCGDSS